MLSVLNSRQDFTNQHHQLGRPTLKHISGEPAATDTAHAKIIIIYINNIYNNNNFIIINI